MNLTEKPDIVTRPDMHYVFIEKMGQFSETAPGAWESIFKLVPEISKNNTITGYLSLYKIKPDMIYRAGVSIAAPALQLPDGLAYAISKGGTYYRFILTGPYSDLPEASGRVFELVAARNIKMRDDFCIESYTSDPETTPEDKYVTEILIPAK
jgi:effector-binding domain-containing protein